MINVTKPYLPSIEDYSEYLQGIWKRNWLTNHGPLVNELELKLKEYFEIDHLLYVSNGTVALQAAIKTLEKQGEIITTPFSYVATTSSIVWENFTPVYVDVDPKDGNIDPLKIKNAITGKTKAIIATHVYGNPCQVDELIQICEEHSITLIFDSAHCFGTKYKGKSILAYGDINAISFHATKVYHTIEGGAVITKKPETLKKIASMANFGHVGTNTFDQVGINAKNSEFHAAMGLCNLNHIDDILLKRKHIYEKYQGFLTQSSMLRFITLNPDAEFNYSYCPVIFESKELCEKIIRDLNDNRIFPRRYFYPALTDLPYVKEFEVPNAISLADRVICLPSYFDLSMEEVDMICRIMLRSLKYG